MRARLTLLPALLLALLVTGRPAAAQPIPERFGLWGALGFDLHATSLYGVPGLPSCAPEYSSGFGLGPSFGAVYERPLGDDLVLELRAGWVASGAALSIDETQTVEIDDAAVPITIEHRIDAALGSLALAPNVGWRASRRLTLSGGAELGWMLVHDFEQREQLSDADLRGRFENGRRVRNEAAGDLPNASTLQAALQLRAAYDLPLDAAGRFSAAPEIVATYALLPVVSGESWYAHSVRAGVALKFVPPATPLEPVAATPQPAPPALHATVLAVGLDAEGIEEPVARVRVEELVASEMRPLLGYVFFDESSSAIPGRYVRRAAVGFALDSLHGRNALDQYHELLNVIGLRMRERPEARLRLVGTNAGSESGDRALSRSRAEAVREYLREAWQIAESRMDIAAIDRPTIASNNASVEGIAENRRVEITGSDPVILSPVRTDDTMRATTPPSIRFHVTASSGAEIASWRLAAMQHGEVLKEIRGVGAVPGVLDWHVEREPGSVPRAPGVLQYQLSIDDVHGASYVTALATLPVEQVTVRRKRRDRIADVTVERYNLILFAYDRSELGAEQRRVLATVRAAIAQNARVSVTGFTDASGDAEHNARLAVNRARTVARELGIADERIEIRGEPTPRFDQSLPEGRFHSRGVEIEIRTPSDVNQEEG